MTLLAAIQPVDVLAAVGVGVAGVGLASGGLAWLRARQRKRVQQLVSASVDFEAMANAASRAQREKPELIHEVLRSAVADVAADQRLADGLVTGAIFGAGPDGSLRILEGQTVNLNGTEYAIEVWPGETGVGEAFQTGNPVVTVFRSPFEESTIQDPKQRELINPALRWIIAIPVVAGDHHALWVLSIAGLVDVRSPEQLQSSVGRLLYYREFLELLLKGIAGEKK
jgi:hypothetical protein